MPMISLDLQQRHSWYGQLLLLCLLVLISFALPKGWGYTSSLGYLCHESNVHLEH